VRHCSPVTHMILLVLPTLDFGRELGGVMILTCGQYSGGRGPTALCHPRNSTSFGVRRWCRTGVESASWLLHLGASSLASSEAQSTARACSSGSSQDLHFGSAFAAFESVS